jgi:ankyrin repeat protein
MLVMSNIKHKAKIIITIELLMLSFSICCPDLLSSDNYNFSIQVWITKLSQGYRPLHLAALAGNDRWVKFLLDWGINPNNRNQWGETALHGLMAEKDYHWYNDIITLLLKAGTDPNLANAAGITPVHIAAGGNSTEILKLLMDYGGNLNSVDSQGNSPVHFAVANSNPGIIELMIENSANLNIRNHQGEYPLHWAVGNGNLLCVQILIDQGVDPDIQDYSGNTPLHWAVFGENPEMVELLIFNNCETEIVNHQQLSALDITEKYLKYSSNFWLIKQIILSADRN